MLNNFVIVGRIDNVEVEEDKIVLTVKVKRSYKNAMGEYDSDLLEIQTIKKSGNIINEYCNVGDIIGAKGRIKTGNLLVAEKITFLSSNS